MYIYMMNLSLLIYFFFFLIKIFRLLQFMYQNNYNDMKIYIKFYEKVNDLSDWCGLQWR